MASTGIGLRFGAESVEFDTSAKFFRRSKSPEPQSNTTLAVQAAEVVSELLWWSEVCGLVYIFVNRILST